MEQPADVVVVMGVSGAGKTTVGRELAARLGWEFADADDFHSPSNVDKMRAGIALDDVDRAGWLAAIGAQIERWQRAGQPAVVTCSALKRRYRAAIVGQPCIHLVYLRISRAQAAQRVASRRGHYMPASLVESQFDALEEPGAQERAITVDAAQPVDSVVLRVTERLADAGASVPDDALDPGAAARPRGSR